MILAIDCDNVLADLAGPWAAWIARNHDPKFTLDRWTSFNVEECANGGSLLYDFIAKGSTFRYLPVVEGAAEGLAALNEEYRVVVVSSVSAIFWHHRLEWLAQHFPFLAPEQFVAMKDKSMLRADVLIDDSLTQLYGFAGGLPVVFDRPWNRSPSRPMLRAWDWSSLLEILL